jgi:ribosome-associated protein YbcJ (S4-like RNA binding protein)
MKLSKFLVLIGLTTSTSEAKRAIKQGAVSMLRDNIKFILKADMPIIWN